MFGNDWFIHLIIINTLFCFVKKSRLVAKTKFWAEKWKKKESYWYIGLFQLGYEKNLLEIVVCKQIYCLKPQTTCHLPLLTFSKRLVKNNSYVSLRPIMYECNSLFHTNVLYWRWLSSELLHRAVWKKFSDVSVVLTAFIIRTIMDHGRWSPWWWRQNAPPKRR
jgi:hypothetical protein